MSDFKIQNMNQGPSIERMERLKNTKDLGKLEKAAKEFEGFYMDLVMKSMRETAAEPEVFGGSGEAKMFQSMLDTEYAKTSTERGNIGLAAAIVKQLAPNIQKTTDPS